MFNKLLLATLLVMPILAEKVEDIEESLVPFPYVLDVELAHTSLSRSIAGSSSVVESKVKDVTYATVSATLFPDTYDIALSYSQSIRQNLDSNLYNPLNNDDDAHHSSISTTPYYHSKYGGVGIFYTESEQNGQYKNKTNSTIRLSEYLVTDKIRFQQIEGTDNLKSNESFQSKEKFSYLGLKYLLPEYEYLPKGANLFYSKMKRDSIYFGTFKKGRHLINVSNDGEMYGIGLHRSMDDLPEDKISMYMLQLSKGKFDGFPDIELEELSAGLTYKAKNWYLKLDGLIYVAKKFTHQFKTGVLTVPKHTDVLVTAHLGTSF